MLSSLNACVIIAQNVMLFLHRIHHEIALGQIDDSK
jgi:hypothetical protein